MNFYFETNEKKYQLIRLCDEYITDTACLCDCCAGDNLYPIAHLKQAVSEQNCHYFLLIDEKENVEGYLFLKILDRNTLEKELKKELPIKFEPVVRFCAIGIREELRRQGASRWLMDFAISYSKESLHADYIAGAFWKQGECVPMQTVLQEFDFVYIDEVKNFWWNVDKLYCPICHGRCICSAAIYGRQL